MAERDAAAVAALRRGNPGMAVGVGHSMGGMLTVMAQARARYYDALGLLGWWFSARHGLPELDQRLADDALAVARDPAAVLFELPKAGDNHNVAPNRLALWDRIADWVRERRPSR